MQKEVKKVPQLRFKEFTEDWKSSKLGVLCSKVGSGSTPRGGSEVYQKNGIPFIRSQNVIDNQLILDDTCISEEINEKMKGSIVQANDILLNITGGSIGRSCVVPENFEIGNVNQHVSIIRLKKDKPKFIQSFLSSYKGQKLILRGQTGSGREGLNFQSIRGFKILLPSIKEQQKIASFLLSVDTKLNLLQQKKDRLEEYKKGVMQQLFSQQLRFKDDDGNEFPKWEEKKYKDIYTFYSTNSLSRNKLNYEVGKVKNIHYGDIHTKFSTLYDITKELTPYINNDIDLSKIKEENYLKNGDLLIADASEDYNDIGKTIEVVNLNKEKVISGLHTFHARPNKYKMALGFAGYLVKDWSVRKQVMKIAQGTKVLGISTSRLGNIKLTIPSLEEQTKIATFLSTIDKKITLVDTQIENTQQFKKGLLQQMFV
ncbi:restriction endonuclease subunit S [Kordia sp. TARA_039_SRF]|nr:restriction endonuclease subunit S [Kordia sp. TARA_039_SRF]